MTQSRETFSRNDPRSGQDFIETIAKLGQRLRALGRRARAATPCLVKATAAIGPDAAPAEGYVVRLSEGQATFRPTSLHVVRRNRAPTLLSIAGRSFQAVVLETTDAGYRLGFRSKLSEEALRACLAESRVSLGR